ncbi:MAG: hypothetical protein NWT08_14235 [Akkermansiaceae bacterium]|jgi:hypothetical protein|nr:hypothetical protein [Akkermansiaceae bacterium]MDP4780470.1 hypothetical protein [Akkermansiaceae bacterium]
MQKRDVHSEMEAALQRLMPVGLSQGVHEELEERIDELASENSKNIFNFYTAVKWMTGLGMAAAVTFGVFLGFTKDGVSIDRSAGVVDGESDVVFLEEADRVEQVSDEGLYVDAGGSAVRKLRVRVVEESRMRDKQTGIVVNLSAPREETYLVPISTF